MNDPIMNPICPSFEFYERKVREHGGENRRTLVYEGETPVLTDHGNLIAVVVEAKDGQVFIITATPEEEDTQTNHRFVFNNSSYDEICKNPLPFIDMGINMFSTALREQCQGTA